MAFHPSKIILRSYAVALLSCAVAAVLTKTVKPMFDTHFFELFEMAVVVSAWYGGLGPGLLAGGISAPIIAYFFIPPVHSFSLHPTDLLRLVIFAAVAVLTSSLSGKLKRAYSELEKTHGKLEKVNDELEIRIKDRTRELYESNWNLTQEIAHRMDVEKAILEVSHREQMRLGQDLHDGLSQILAGTKLITGGVRDKLAEKNLPESHDLEKIEARLSDALTYVDTISRGLYPVELERNGLMAALEELAKKTSQSFSVACRFVCRKSVYFADGAIPNHVFRIAQEAVMNALKGGKATRISIRLTLRGPHVILSVVDNGSGMGKGPIRKGMGLKLMEYRSRVINGIFKLRSRSSGGTKVSCQFPLQLELPGN